MQNQSIPRPYDRQKMSKEFTLVKEFKQCSIELENLKNISNMIQKMQNTTVERIITLDKKIKQNHAKAKEL